MSNVTVQEALKKSLARFQMIDAGQTIFVRDAIDDCKAALADIEKCEPVAWRWFNKHTFAHTLSNYAPSDGFPDDAIDVDPLYTSPQPRDCEDWQYFDKAYKKAAETSDATDWMNAALLAQQVRRNQLNTKG